MKTKIVPRIWLTLVVAIWSCHAVDSIYGDSLGEPDVPQLIAQLGDDQYLLRQRAETQLLERGVEAFAQLQAAENHADLEIATRASYILNQISIEWVRPTDPPIVRSIMARYGDLSVKSQLEKIAELSKLEHEQGFGALCRIARFESAGLIARYAALAILENGFLPPERTAAAVATLRSELGEGVESPVSWVGVYVDQLESPQAIDPRWLNLVDVEMDLLDEDTTDTNEALVLSLLRCQLDLSDELSDVEAISAGLQRRVEFGGGDSDAIGARLIDAITWIVDREQWDALELLEERYAEEIRQQRLVLYHLAVAREKQGRQADAELLAERALEFRNIGAEERNEVADIVAELGRHDWAEREWRAVINTTEATDMQSMLARQDLALFCLHDRLHHKAAADLLTESLDAIDADEAIKRAYQNDPKVVGRLTQFRSNRDYFLACHYGAESEFEQQRRYLDKAYKLEPDNADIVIAMFKVQEADDAYRAKTRQRLADAKAKLEKEIRQLSKMRRRTTDIDMFLAHRHNHWAWLVSNTEGDFDKAVQYSKRSLELEPGSPSYLDTLGRCYYAVGDLENAVKVQREAVAKHPHLQVMQRQLQSFEDELQKQQTNAAAN